ncbi:MAG: ferrochelatase [Leptospiraceae bacterium]|nr:ferrochelatase [Leptospiraceae bacterium]MDW7975776.1 ferrochelatase [Leptospiraceae bacterium]
MKNQKNVAVLFINLGTPSQLKESIVKKYLSEFLMDERVIDIPYLYRSLLVNVIIAPHRAKKSLEKYKKIWNYEKNESPLITITRSFISKLKSGLPDILIDFAMRYGEPRIEEKLNFFYRQGVRYLYVIPLYPQYATSTIGSSLASVYKINSKFWDPMMITVHPVIYNDPEFIDLWVKHIQDELPEFRNYYFIFSFHGVPVRHIEKSDQKNVCLKDNCCEIQQPEYCYRAQCFYLAKQISHRLGLDDYLVAFQSRLGKEKWTQPYLEEVIIDVAKKHDQICVVPLSFVSDSLETLEELQITIKEMLMSHRIKNYKVIPALNDKNEWIEYWKNNILKFLEN